MDFEFDFHKTVEEFLDAYEFEYRYDEEEDVYVSGVTFDDLGNVTLLIMNGGSKITVVGEMEWILDHDLVYYRVSDFVHRFNSMDCVATLFLDPDMKKMYFKRNTYILNVMDPELSFSKDFFRVNLEMDMFGKAFSGVLSGVLSDLEAIELVERAIEEYNNQLYEDAENLMN